MVHCGTIYAIWGFTLDPADAIVSGYGYRVFGNIVQESV
mgnify:CR=1 FL=1